MKYTFYDFLSLCKEFKLFEYLNGTDFSNRSIDILNLLKCNNRIRGLITHHVIQTGIWDWSKLQLFDQKELELIKSIRLEIDIGCQEIMRVLPNLNCISIGAFFKENIDYMIPPNLQRLEFKQQPIFRMGGYKSSDFKLLECKITNLPKSLTYLDLGDNFGFRCSLEKIDVLPDSLEYLNLGHYKFPLPRLPENLKCLKSKRMHYKINKFPQNLTHLDLNHNDFYGILDYFVHPDPNIFLPNLAFLKLSGKLNALDLKLLPRSLTHLELDRYFDKDLHPNEFPAWLTFLKMTSDFNHSIEPGVLPACLKYLELGNSFCRSLPQGVFPQSLQELTFGNDFNIRIKVGILPPNLKKLVFGKMFNSHIKHGVLPAKLEYLKFGESFDQPLDPGVLPIGLLCLIFGHAWDQPISKKMFPDNLLSLTFGHKFNRIIEKNDLPEKLTTLILGSCFDFPIAHAITGLKLKNIVVGKNYKYPKIDQKAKNKKEFVKIAGKRCVRKL